MKWENSEERNKQVESGKAVFEQAKSKLQLTGLEFWFENKNGKSNNVVPVKWKMQVITVATIFGLLNKCNHFGRLTELLHNAIPH